MNAVAAGATEAKPARPFESIAGLWKLGCALAVLIGHNLVTLTAWQPEDKIWSVSYHLIQFFSPLHFFLFSGYLAASGLSNPRRSLKPMMIGRGLRIYVLVVAALAWGLCMRWLVKRLAGTDSLGSLWPLDVWDGDINPIQLAMHLNPFGFADHISFNYATWYLYQELRIVLLFPLFRWILGRPASLTRWTWAGTLLCAAAILEFKLWSFFPMFRSSPFQSLAFGVYFLCGALVWLDLREGRWLARIPTPMAVVLLVVGVAISFFESMGIRPQVSNPPVLMVTVLVGQILVVVGLLRTVGNFKVPDWLRGACDWSVGIYIVHPPIHVLAVWYSLSHQSFWPIPVGIGVSLLLGVGFHKWVEAPSQGLVRKVQGSAD